VFASLCTSLREGDAVTDDADDDDWLAECVEDLESLAARLEICGL
jgi:hypothetical protein